MVSVVSVDGVESVVSTNVVGMWIVRMEIMGSNHDGANSKQMVKFFPYASDSGPTQRV